MTGRDVPVAGRIWSVLWKIWLLTGVAVLASFIFTDSVFGHDCSTEADCLQTAGYLIASAIASSGMGVFAGLLGGNMAATLQSVVQQRVTESVTQSVGPTEATGGTQVEPAGVTPPPPPDQVMEVPEGFPQTRPEPPPEPEPDLPPGNEVPAGTLAGLPDVDIKGSDRNAIIDMLRGTDGGSVILASAPVFGYPGATVPGSLPIKPPGSEPNLTSGESGGIFGVDPGGAISPETTGETAPGEGSAAEEQMGVDESQVTDDMLPSNEAEGSGEGDKQVEPAAGTETGPEPGGGTEVTEPPDKQNVRLNFGDFVLEEVTGPDGNKRMVTVDRTSWYDGTTTVNVDYNLETGDPLRGSASGQLDQYKWNASQSDKDEFNFNLNRIDPNRPGVGSVEFHGGGGQEASGSVTGRTDNARWSAEQTPDDKFNASWNRLNQSDAGIRHGEVHAGGGQDFSANLSGGYREANWNLNYNQDKLDAYWTRVNQNDPGLRAAHVQAGGGQDFGVNLQGGSRGLNWQASFSEQNGFTGDLSSTRQDTVFQRMQLGQNPELDLRVSHSRNFNLDLNLRDGGSGATLTHRPTGISVSYGRDGFTGPLDDFKAPGIEDVVGPMSGSGEKFMLGARLKF